MNLKGAGKLREPTRMYICVTTISIAKCSLQGPLGTQPPESCQNGNCHKPPQVTCHICAYSSKWLRIYNNFKLIHNILGFVTTAGQQRHDHNLEIRENKPRRECFLQHTHTHTHAHTYTFIHICMWTQIHSAVHTYTHKQTPF